MKTSAGCLCVLMHTQAHLISDLQMEKIKPERLKDLPMVTQLVRHESGLGMNTPLLTLKVAVKNSFRERIGIKEVQQARIVIITHEVWLLLSPFSSPTSTPC